MTRVQIAETYALNCPDCAETLHRLVTWSCRDSQVSTLTLKAVPRCEHALPTLKGATPVGEVRSISGPTAHPTNPPPPPGSELFTGAEILAAETAGKAAGTGYDEPGAA